MPKARTEEYRKVSVLFPVDLLKKVRMLASTRGESLSRVIVELTEVGLKKEFGDGSVDIEAMEKAIGSIPAGGNALEDSEDIYL